MSRGFISDEDLAVKLARLRRQIVEAGHDPIIRDEPDRFIPVVRPGRWQLASVKRSRDRTDRIAQARKQTEDGTRRRNGSMLNPPGHRRVGSGPASSGRPSSAG